MVAKKVSDAMFGIFADPSQVNIWNIHDMVEVYGLQNRIVVNTMVDSLFGFPSLSDLYASIDILVTPYQEDILNTVVVEASHSAVTLITSTGGATDEYIPETSIRLEKCDIFVAPPANTRYRIFEAEEMAEKILQVIYQPEKKKHLAPTQISSNNRNSDLIRQWIELLG